MSSIAEETQEEGGCRGQLRAKHVAITFQTRQDWAAELRSTQDRQAAAAAAAAAPLVVLLQVPAQRRQLPPVRYTHSF